MSRLPTACKPCVARPPPGAPTPGRHPAHLCQPFQPLGYLRLLPSSLQALHMLFPRPAMHSPQVSISLNSVPTPSPTRVVLCDARPGCRDSAYGDQQMFHIWLGQALVAACGIFPCSMWAPQRAGSVVVAHGRSSCGLWGSVP